MDAFWADWGRGMFGGDAGAEAGRIIQKLDGSHLGINALIRAAPKRRTPKSQSSLRRCASWKRCGPGSKALATLSDFDYWLNLIRASQLRVRTWVLADRLGAKVKEVGAIPEADKKARLRPQRSPSAPVGDRAQL